MLERQSWELFGFQHELEEHDRSSAASAAGKDGKAPAEPNSVQRARAKAALGDRAGSLKQVGLPEGALAKMEEAKQKAEEEVKRLQAAVDGHCTAIAAAHQAELEARGAQQKEQFEIAGLDRKLKAAEAARAEEQRAQGAVQDLIKSRRE